MYIAISYATQLATPGSHGAFPLRRCRWPTGRFISRGGQVWPRGDWRSFSASLRGREGHGSTWDKPLEISRRNGINEGLMGLNMINHD